MTEQLPTFSIHPDNFKDVIVIGGGTCGLAVCARLCERRPASVFTEDEHQRLHWLNNRGSKVNLIRRRLSNTKFGLLNKPICHEQKNFAATNLLVIDAVSDRFMGQWDNQFESLKIPFLRSPMFFHVDPANIDGLVSFAHFSDRESERDLREIKNVVGQEYSKHQLKKLTKKKLKKCPVPNEGVFGSHDKPGLIDINMRDWKDYYRPSTPLFHDFCQDILKRYNIEGIVKKDNVVNVQYGNLRLLDSEQSGTGLMIETASGITYGCKVCVAAPGHEGIPAYPLDIFQNEAHYPYGSCHTSHIIKKEVSFPCPHLLEKVKTGKGTSIVVVGGGLTAAQIADTAIKEGIDKVYLILRSSLKVKHFDFHLDWVTKFRNVKKMAFYLKDTDEERFSMIQQAREGGSVNPEYYKIIMKHIQKKNLEVHMFSEIIDKEWNKETKTWSLQIETKEETVQRPRFNKVTHGTWTLNDVDYICFATGMQADVRSLPFLKSLVKDHPIEIANGLPCLTDNLQWNEDIPFFMLGKYAGLRTGPASANLDGARSGAERIGWLIQDWKERGLLDWNSDSRVFPVIEDTEVTEPFPPPFSSTQTRLKLASGQMNWFSLLQEV